MTIPEAKKIFGLISINETKLKKRYRELVMKYHPDKGGDALTFLKIQEAYELLSNPKNDSNLKDEIKEKKETSDNFSSNNFGQERTQRKKRALDPSDVELNLEVSVEELNEGFEQVVNYTRRKACINCGGNGCYICDGSIKLEHMTVGVYIHSTLMNNKYEIIYKGLGDITYEAADLVIKLKIVGSKYKLVDGTLPIVTSTLLIDSLDKEIIVKTLNGNKKVTLPKDFSSTINLKGQGLKFNTSKGIEYGDHHVYLIIKEN